MFIIVCNFLNYILAVPEILRQSLKMYVFYVTFLIFDVLILFYDELL